MRRRELLAFHGEEFRRDDLSGEVENAQVAGLAALCSLTVVAQHFGRPDLRVEDDVVLAHEVVGQGFGIVPPLAPCFGIPRAACPLDRGAQVADDRVKPYVEALSGLVFPSGNRDTPVNVACHGARTDFLQEVLRELDDVGTPRTRAVTLVQPCRESIGQCRQVQEVVCGFNEFGGLAVDSRVRVDQIGGIKLVTAVITLIAASALGATDRAGTFDVAVGKSTSARGRDRRASDLLDHVTVIANSSEHVLDDAVVVSRSGTRKEVIGQAQLDQVFDDESIVLVGQLARADTRAIGGNQNGGSVLVSSGHHQHVVPGHSHVAREDIGGDSETGDVTNMAGTVGIRPSNGRQNSTHGPLV